MEEMEKQHTIFETSPDISKIAKALLEAQKKMGSANLGSSNPYFKSKYASIGSVLEAVKEPLNSSGIVILQPVVSINNDEYVKTILLHESGQFVSSAMKLILGKKDMQNELSAVTYGRRGTLQALVALPAEDKDGEDLVVRTKTNFSKEAKKETKTIAKEEKKTTGTSFRKKTKTSHAI